MAIDAIAARYADALADFAIAAGQLDALAALAARLRALWRAHSELQALLGNPGVDPSEKATIIRRLVPGDASETLSAFIQMVAEWGRADALGGILEAFQARVDQERGQMHIRVRSAHSLPEAVLTRVRAHVAALEKKRVDVTAEVDPSLLGGLQIILDHRVIDGSVRRRLDDLRERLLSVRVH